MPSPPPSTASVARVTASLSASSALESGEVTLLGSFAQTPKRFLHVGVLVSGLD
jgi:hypothetical protein